MQFRQWLERQEELEAKASAMPASAQVIRSGLQPQVNSQEIKTVPKEHFDRMAAVDGHMERIRHAIKGEKSELRKVCDRMLELWDGFKNKPRPTPKGEPELQNQMPAGPGTLGNDSGRPGA
jgi:hypothetical protein